MSFELPTPIAAYFRADPGSDLEAFARCFTHDAIVIDEGKTYRGAEAVKQWKSETSAKFTYDCEPLAIKEEAGRTVVTCRLAGTFPGSPLDLRFLFGLEKNKIASLEIVP